MEPAAESRLAMLLTAALAIAAPDATGAQLTSARPASVSLTVVVPPRTEAITPVVAVEPLNVIHRGMSAVDIEASVGVGQPATRVEVSLSRGWRANGVRVWARNSHGDLERLVAQERIVAVERPITSAAVMPTVRLLVELDRPHPGEAVVVPVEYRVQVRSSDAAATWTFVSLFRVDSVP